MSTALTVKEDAALIPVLSSSLYPGAAEPSIVLVLNYCRAAQLDPLQKPVHIVPMWDGKAKTMRDVIMPGIGLYRTQAARSGRCAGISEPEFGPVISAMIGGVEVVYPEWCRVTVKRILDNGTIAEFTAREFWMENYAVKGGPEKSVAPNAMWTKRGFGQLAKCAEAQALRKAFPELLGSAPTADEMAGKTLDADTIEGAAREIPPPNPWTEELKAAAAAEAKKGWPAYMQWWKHQPESFRDAAVKTTEHDSNKKLAADMSAAQDTGGSEQ
jgi:phage recombination protein Bet